MNLKLKEVFRGKVVNKAHTINTGVDEFPCYVPEYLIDHTCSSHLRPVTHRIRTTRPGQSFVEFDRSTPMAYNLSASLA